MSGLDADEAQEFRHWCRTVAERLRIHHETMEGLFPNIPQLADELTVAWYGAILRPPSFPPEFGAAFAKLAEAQADWFKREGDET